MAEKRELWDQLDNESARAYEAFKIYRAIEPTERSLAKAWRIYVGNPDAKNAGRTFRFWREDFAWKDRAKAYDAHIERIRRKGFEKAIEQEATKNARTTERIMHHANELLVRTYEAAAERLEQEDFAGELRPAEVIQIVKLHIEAAAKIAGTQPQGEAHAEGNWTEEDDNEFANEILADINERRAKHGPIEDDFGREEESSP